MEERVARRTGWMGGQWMEGELKGLIQKAAAALKAAGAHEVYLFGSAAAGSLREDSDIDMAVAGLPPESFYRALAEAAGILRRPFDLVDLDESNAFTEYLKRKGKLRRVA
jgi:predicted nucleotidyltransferase